MGKFVLGVVLSVFLVMTFAHAGESYDVDFSEIPTHSVSLYNDDEVRFQLLGGEHIIIIEDVGTSSIKVDVGPFIDQQTVLTPGLIGLDYLMKLDLDKDGTADLNVALYSISEDGQVQLVLQDITVGDKGEVSEDVGVVEETQSLSKRGVLIGLGILVLMLVLFFVFRDNIWGDSGTKEEMKTDHEHKEDHDHAEHTDHEHHSHTPKEDTEEDAKNSS